MKKIKNKQILSALLLSIGMVSVLEAAKEQTYTAKDLFGALSEKQVSKFLNNSGKLPGFLTNLGLNKEEHYFHIFEKFNETKISSNKYQMVNIIQKMKNEQVKADTLAKILEKTNKSDIEDFIAIIKSCVNANIGSIFNALANQKDLSDEETMKYLKECKNFGVTKFETVEEIEAHGTWYQICTPLLNLVQKNKPQSAIWFFEEYYNPNNCKSSCTIIPQEKLGFFSFCSSCKPEIEINSDGMKNLSPSEQRFFAMIKAALKLGKTDLAKQILKRKTFNTYLKNPNIEEEIMEASVESDNAKVLEKLTTLKNAESTIGLVFKRGKSHLLKTALLDNFYDNKIKEWLKKGKNAEYFGNIFADKNLDLKELKSIAKHLSGTFKDAPKKTQEFFEKIVENTDDIHIVDTISKLIDDNKIVLKSNFKTACNVIGGKYKSEAKRWLEEFPILMLIYLAGNNPEITEIGQILSYFGPYVSGQKQVPSKYLLLTKNTINNLKQEILSLGQYCEKNKVKFDRIEEILQNILPCVYCKGIPCIAVDLPIN